MMESRERCDRPRVKEDGLDDRRSGIGAAVSSTAGKEVRVEAGRRLVRLDVEMTSSKGDSVEDGDVGVGWSAGRPGGVATAKGGDGKGQAWDKVKGSRCKVGER